jgi:hypothetical protein
MNALPAPCLRPPLPLLTCCVFILSREIRASPSSLLLVQHADTIAVSALTPLSEQRKD